ncbi:MAG TPA: amino acid adenylation domain-containing protein [Candidatus Binatia bacterium]|nr:amino acid adenylation domain-containing protein [Candidatus Binatia bacterium]
MAVKTKDGALTYDQSNQLANRVAHALLRRRQQIEEPVAFLLGSSILQITAILGILKAGKIYVPLDPSLPASRLATILEDSQASLIVSDRQNHSSARELAQGTFELRTLEDFASSLPATNPGLTISPATLMNILYTSGSTGRPKRVMSDHRSALHDAMSSTHTYGISRDDRLVLLFSTGFAAALTSMFGALLNGATLFPFDLKTQGFVDLANWLMQEQVTFYYSGPSTFRRFVATLPETAHFPHLRLIMLGTEPVYKRDVELYKKHFPDECLLCVRLGGTETRSMCSYFIDKATQIETKTVPVGYAAEDKEIFLLDEDGQAVATNQMGEIAVKSRYLARGYWRQAQLTHTVFQPDPQGGEERIYRTGDLGQLHPDGCLEYLGRKDSQVKIRGHRVEIGEVEMALLDLERVKEAAVAVREDSTGRTYLAAYLVPRSTPLPASDVLRAALAKTLPAYMIPSHFLTLESLPLTATGKVDYHALPEPPRTRPDLQTDFLAPRTTVETELQQIWQEILDIQPIGIQDNFFALGGDSLAAEEVLTRIEHAFHLILPPDVFIHGPTIKSLANILLRPESAIVKSSLIAIQSAGSKPPFFCVSGYDGTALPLRSLGPYFAPDQPFYGLRDPRLGHKRISFTRIEDIAPRHIKTLLTHQPQGPYYLGGYSFGCLIAFEIAQQLQKAGHKVKALVFLDLPRSCRPQRPSVTPGAKMNLLIKQEGLAKFLQRIPWRLFLLAKRFTPSFISSLSVREANILAKANYVPQTYAGRVIFFQTRYNQDIPQLWENLLTGGIEIYHIPGDHHTMWREPNVQPLAEKLRAVLVQAQMYA